MTARRIRLWVAAALVFVVGLSLDQLTKAWAITGLADDREIPLIPTVSLRLEFNPGAAFGLGADAGPATAVGILAVLVALSAWICWQTIKANADSRLLLLVAAAAGGWGNMYDRVSRATDVPLSGTVVDFIAVDWFAIFNVGDILAVGGLIGWVVLTAFTRPRIAGVAAAPDSDVNTVNESPTARN